MKIVWILCLCFVTFQRFGCEENETSTLETTFSDITPTTSSADAITISSTIETETTSETTVSEPTSSTVSSTSDSPSTESTASETTENVTSPTDNTSIFNDSITSSTPVAEVGNAKESKPEVNGTAYINNFSDQVRQIIQHFQQPNPVGFPGQNILQDPMFPPNVSTEAGIFSSADEFYNISIHGLSNFRVETVELFLNQMEVYMTILVNKVLILGDCTVHSLVFFTSKGPFNLTLTNVTAEGAISLVIDADGTLHAVPNKTVTKLNYGQLQFHLGAPNASSTMNSAVDTIGQVVITAIEPFIRASIDDRLTTEVEKLLKKSPKFPAISKMSPVDLAISKARQYVKFHHEPYTIPVALEYNTTFLLLNVTDVKLHGLSKFARVGEVSMRITDKTMIFKLRMITGKILGECKFVLDFGRIPQTPARHGSTKFGVEHLQFEAVVHQSFNFSVKPRLQDLQLEVGPVRVQFDGKGKFDYVVELGLTHLPSLLRHLLLDALEVPIKRRIQDDILNQIDVDKLVSNNLPTVDRVLQENLA